MPAIDRWLEGGHYPHPMRAVGAGDPPPPGDPARLALADTISVCATREICADSVRRLAAAGADTIVLLAVGDDHEAQIERFAREVMPLLAP